VKEEKKRAEMEAEGIHSEIQIKKQLSMLRGERLWK